MVPRSTSAIGIFAIGLGLIYLFGDKLTAWLQSNPWTALAVPVVQSTQEVANIPIALPAGAWVLIAGLFLVFIFK